MLVWSFVAFGDKQAGVQRSHKAPGETAKASAFEKTDEAFRKNLTKKELAANPFKYLSAEINSASLFWAHPWHESGPQPQNSWNLITSERKQSRSNSFSPPSRVSKLKTPRCCSQFHFICSVDDLFGSKTVEALEQTPSHLVIAAGVASVRRILA